MTGGLSEKVVLCTNTKTFEIKEAEISNSLLLVADLKLAQATSTSPLKSAQGAVNRSLDKSSDSMNDSSENNVADDAENTDVTRHLEQRNVLKVFHEYLECREIKPRFSKLYELLCISRYTGLENEYCIDRSVLFTRQQLINTIQCSPAEFDEGLQRFRVIEIDGRQRMLECEYEYRIVSLMLGIIAEMAWRLDEIDRDETVELLAPNIAPEQIVRGLFDLYAIETPGKTNKEGKPLYGYSELMVCRIVAQNILQQGTKFHMDDFMSTWQDALPDGMKINVGPEAMQNSYIVVVNKKNSVFFQETYLRGIGIIDRDSSSVPCVRSLIESNLPINLQNRLKMLFRTKDKWTLDQIEPYIEYFQNAILYINNSIFIPKL